MENLLWKCFYHTGRIDMYLLYKNQNLKVDKDSPKDDKKRNYNNLRLDWEELLL